MLWIGSGLAVIFIMLLFFAWMRVEATGCKVSRDIVSSSSIPEAFEGVNILLLTDIHRRKLTEKKLGPLLQEADYVFLGGDITEKGVPLKRLEHNLLLLTKNTPTFAVLGNHDLKAGASQVKAILDQTGARLLNDETIFLNRGRSSIALTGYMQPQTRFHPYSRFTGRASKHDFHIVLVHDPIWIQGRKKLPTDLILTGHTHGGQIVLPVLGAVKLEGFYKKYGSGWYDLPRSRWRNEPVKLLISRGFGTSHIPLRYRCPAELHMITLKKTP
ncbi:metallophosphoesterase [Paenibacillus lemnae]|uniref:Metallophosphoesterase n=1 Tax=Paenibacillus lemnae TaxID=1330551 RepID=A0A848M8H8_PAELE|nr:metallophosphoesterase [Paenibacillus lemnae]NMO96945.1 metallophosphoesterase [Paenibacillus lemnae]